MCYCNVVLFNTFNLDCAIALFKKAIKRMLKLINCVQIRSTVVHFQRQMANVGHILINTLTAKSECNYFSTKTPSHFDCKNHKSIVCCALNQCKIEYYNKQIAGLYIQSNISRTILSSPSPGHRLLR